jgi:hypothetical protein
MVGLVRLTDILFQKKTYTARRCQTHAIVQTDFGLGILVLFLVLIAFNRKKIECFCSDDLVDLVIERVQKSRRD